MSKSVKFCVFGAISVQFQKDFVNGSNTIKSEKTSNAVHFLKRTLQRFASKTFQNDSEWVGTFQHFHVFMQLMRTFALVWNQNVGKRSTKIDCIIQYAFKKNIPDFGHKVDRKK